MDDEASSCVDDRMARVDSTAPGRGPAGRGDGGLGCHDSGERETELSTARRGVDDPNGEGLERWPSFVCLHRCTLPVSSWTTQRAQDCSQGHDLRLCEPELVLERLLRALMRTGRGAVYTVARRVYGGPEGGRDGAGSRGLGETIRRGNGSLELGGGQGAGV